MPVAAPLYPVGLVLDGRPCLVVGGGRIAARKVAGLVACGASVTVVASDVCDELASCAGVRIERRRYRSGEAAGYRLVVTATGDEHVAQQVFDDAEAAGVWVNSADDPARCTFTLPAVLRRGPVTLAVATGGASPAFASWLRDHVDGLLGPEVDDLAVLVAEARAGVVAGGRSTEGLDWREALDSDMLDLIRAGRIDVARERLRTWTQEPADRTAGAG